MYYEASGTSGMKVCPNGGINLSILDGWWYEGYEIAKEKTGWAIGKEEEYDDHAFQDRVESEALYYLLEKEIIPLFYKRGKDGLPRQWINRMKISMKNLCPEFRTGRMVYDYTEKFYIPAGKRYQSLLSNKLKGVKELAGWKKKVCENWKDVHIVNTAYNGGVDYKVGSDVKVTVDLRLGKLTSDDVQTQVYYGTVDHDGKVEDGKSLKMEFSTLLPNGLYRFNISIPCCTSGQHGYGIRVLPNHKDVVDPLKMGLIVWET